MDRQALHIITATLDKYYPFVPADLRTKRTAFQCLVATILSAQSTGKQTATAANNLFEAGGNTPQNIVSMGEKEIQRLIKSVGLWRNKAKNIYKASQTLIEKFNSVVPSDLAQLQSLPGVGPKTAAIVLVFFFGQPAMPVDTHVFRCARRWGMSVSKTASRVSQDLQKIFPAAEWGKRHLQIVSFGRHYCKALRHDTATCPMCSLLSRSHDVQSTG